MVARRPRDILVIHPGALGDVLQAVPALEALRALPGNPRLTFAGQARIGALLAETGAVDASLSFDGLKLDALFVSDPVPSEVRSRLGRFDGVVSWFGSRADLFGERLRSIVPRALLAPPIPEAGVASTVWEYLVGTLQPWGVKVPSALSPLKLSPACCSEARHALSRLVRDDSRPLLFVHPGAGGARKLWPAENFARVLRLVTARTACQVLVHRGPADHDAVDRLTRALEFAPPLLIDPPLHLLAAILAEAAAYLGGDSGVSHLAAAVGAPAVILFPPAARERWAPWSPAALPLAMPAADTDEADDHVARSLVERLARGKEGLFDGAV